MLFLGSKRPTTCSPNSSRSSAASMMLKHEDRRLLPFPTLPLRSGWHADANEGLRDWNVLRDAKLVCRQASSVFSNIRSFTFEASLLLLPVESEWTVRGGDEGRRQGSAKRVRVEARAEKGTDMSVVRSIGLGKLS